MNAMLLPLFFICGVGGEEPKVVFDDRPERGIPQEAQAQTRADSPSREELTKLYTALTGQEGDVQWPAKFHNSVGAIKTVRIRYFNKEMWKGEKEAREYVRGFLTNKSSEVFGFQIWSQGLGVPEIECLVDFTDEYRKKLRDEGKPCDTGRLLIWNTEACFRDATGRWWFVTLFDYYHGAHPKGNRKLAKPKQPE